MGCESLLIAYCTKLKRSTMLGRAQNCTPPQIARGPGESPEILLTHREAREPQVVSSRDTAPTLNLAHLHTHMVRMCMHRRKRAHMHTYTLIQRHIRTCYTRTYVHTCMQPRVTTANPLTRVTTATRPPHARDYCYATPSRA